MPGGRHGLTSGSVGVRSPPVTRREVLGRTRGPLVKLHNMRRLRCLEDCCQDIEAQALKTRGWRGAATRRLCKPSSPAKSRAGAKHREAGRQREGHLGGLGCGGHLHPAVCVEDNGHPAPRPPRPRHPPQQLRHCRYVGVRVGRGGDGAGEVCVFPAAALVLVRRPCQELAASDDRHRQEAWWGGGGGQRHPQDDWYITIRQKRKIEGRRTAGGQQWEPLVLTRGREFRLSCVRVHECHGRAVVEEAVYKQTRKRGFSGALRTHDCHDGHRPLGAPPVCCCCCSSRGRLVGCRPPGLRERAGRRAPAAAPQVAELLFPLEDREALLLLPVLT